MGRGQENLLYGSVPIVSKRKEDPVLLSLESHHIPSVPRLMRSFDDGSEGGVIFLGKDHQLYSVSFHDFSKKQLFSLAKAPHAAAISADSFAWTDEDGEVYLKDLRSAGQEEGIIKVSQESLDTEVNPFRLHLCEDKLYVMFEVEGENGQSSSKFFYTYLEEGLDSPDNEWIDFQALHRDSEVVGMESGTEGAWLWYSSEDFGASLAWIGNDGYIVRSPGDSTRQYAVDVLSPRIIPENHGRHALYLTDNRLEAFDLENDKRLPLGEINTSQLQHDFLLSEDKLFVLQQDGQEFDRSFLEIYVREEDRLRLVARSDNSFSWQKMVLHNDHLILHSKDSQFIGEVNLEQIIS